MLVLSLLRMILTSKKPRTPNLCSYKATALFVIASIFLSITADAVGIETVTYCSMPSQRWSCTMAPIKSQNSNVSSIDDTTNVKSTKNVAMNTHDYHHDNEDDEMKNSDNRKAKKELDITYQIPTNPIDGRMFVAARIQWKIQKSELFAKNEAIFFLHGINDVTNSSFYYNITINRVGRDSLFERTIDVIVLMEDIFELGNSYRVTVINETKVLWSKRLKIPMVEEIPAENVVCDESNITKIRGTAARWVTGMQTYVNPVYRRLTVEFTKAPTQFCFQNYEVTLFAASYIQLKSIIVSSDSVVDTGFHNNTIRVVFNDLPSEQNITVQVIPIERQKGTDVCLCQLGGSRCGCVTALSQPISMANYQIIIPKSYQQMNNFEEQMDLNYGTVLTVVIIITGVLMVLLLIVIVIGACFVRRNQHRWTSVRLSFKRKVVLQPGKTNHHVSLEPLINDAKNESVWLISSNNHDNAELLKFAYHLMEAGVDVACPMLDLKEIETRKHHYILRHLFNANKIVLLHGSNAKELLCGKSLLNEGQCQDINTEIYATVTSMLNMNDSRILHIKPEYVKASFPFTETIFEFPRDYDFLFKSFVDRTESSGLSSVSIPVTAPTSLLNTVPLIIETVIDGNVDDKSDFSMVSVVSDQEDDEIIETQHLAHIENLENPLTELLYQKKLPYQSSEDDSGVHSL